MDHYLFYAPEKAGEGDIWYQAQGIGVRHGLLQLNLQNAFGNREIVAIPRIFVDPVLQDVFLDEIYQGQIRNYAPSVFVAGAEHFLLVVGLGDHVAVMLASMIALNAERLAKLARKGKDDDDDEDDPSPPPPCPPCPPPPPPPPSCGSVAVTRPDSRMWEKVVTCYKMNGGVCSHQRVTSMIKTPKLAADICTVVAESASHDEKMSGHVKFLGFEDLLPFASQDVVSGDDKFLGCEDLFQFVARGTRHDEEMSGYHWFPFEDLPFVARGTRHDEEMSGFVRFLCEDPFQFGARGMPQEALAGYVKFLGFAASRSKMSGDVKFFGVEDLCPFCWASHLDLKSKEASLDKEMSEGDLKVVRNE